MIQQLSIFGQSLDSRGIAVDEAVTAMIRNASPVAIGVSGGKDSDAAAFATNDYLNEQGHAGPRLLIHSDLGSVEWKDSLPACERLAEAVGLPLVTVRRAAGGMMERWETRWENNVRRYADLECVKLILPWSTAAMRFCTSELKTAVICRELVRRFPGREILSVAGIRRDESASRAKATVSKPQAKLTSHTHGTAGRDWNPILDWRLPSVFSYLAEKRFPLHEAYTRWGSSRVSCSFCILASRADLRASAGCADNQEIYRRMVDLEIRSSFSFQDAQWLGDVAPDLLHVEQRLGLAVAKERAARRKSAEAKIPRHLLYTKGWPTAVPNAQEAELLCRVRREVADTLGLTIRYTTPEELVKRYEDLMKAIK